MPVFDDASWADVSVPHCFNAEDTFLPKRGYYRGPAWYRRVLPPTPAGQRVELCALGAFAVTHVWLNGELVVDNVTMENYWNRKVPIYPTGQLELQSHGSLLWFRNVFVREIPRGK